LQATGRAIKTRPRCFQGFAERFKLFVRH
jgi:hypothetical protein